MTAKIFHALCWVVSTLRRASELANRFYGGGTSGSFSVHVNLKNGKGLICYYFKHENLICHSCHF
jgi:hypothetical protein